MTTVPPFIWDPERRFQLRCEIDAAFFHLYGISRDDTAYILDYVSGPQAVGESASTASTGRSAGCWRLYDALASAAATSVPYAYESLLRPPRRAK